MPKYYSLEQIKSAVKITHEKYGGMSEEFDIYKLMQMPSADVVEVVRCKDCKYRIVIPQFPDHPYCEHRLFGRNVAPDFFCAYGEKK